MAEKIKPEIIAAIMAAVQAMGVGGKVISVKIKRNEVWALASKIKR